MADLEIIKTLGTEIACIREMMLKHGHRRLLKKNEYFCRANSSNSLIAYVVKGGLKYCCHDYSRSLESNARKNVKRWLNGKGLISVKVFLWSTFYLCGIRYIIHYDNF